MEEQFARKPLCNTAKGTELLVGAVGETTAVVSPVTEFEGGCSSQDKEWPVGPATVAEGMTSFDTATAGLRDSDASCCWCPSCKEKRLEENYC